jgi:hypothetical protein
LTVLEEEEFVSKGRIKIIACATVLEEMLPFMSLDQAYEVLDFGLHLRPKNLKDALQEAIDASADEFDVILLGYGLCSMAVVGLKANNCTLVIPRVDDCIACFLGSQDAYLEQQHKEPGTYYLTKGWIEVSDTLLDEYNRMVEKYGAETAERIMGIMLKNYRRLVYIDTGVENQEKYRAYAQKVAEQFGLHFEEMRGSDALIQKMLARDWASDFVVAGPGEEVTYAAFKTKARTAANLNLYQTGPSQ